MKQGIYLKQAFRMLRETPLISSVSIVGTAISIAMIMSILLVFQIEFAGYYPETHRDRTLYALQSEVKNNSGGWNRGGFSPEVLKACFYPLERPEAVAGITKRMQPLSLPTKRMYKQYTVCYTDPGFWKLFDFRFTTGKPFTQADFDAGLPVAVVSEPTARKLYGTTDVLGKPVIIDEVAYTICGVVPEVSTATIQAYGDVWTTYTSCPLLTQKFTPDGWTGYFHGLILARSADDFDAIRQELDQAIARLNSTTDDYVLGLFDGVITSLDVAIGSNGQINEDPKRYFAQMGLTLLFLLLVPALNLSGVAHSSVQKRRAEMGVRRAFGAPCRALMGQVLVENGLTTLLGGLLGILLSLLCLPVCKEFMLRQSDVVLQADMLFRPMSFVGAFLFMGLLNLLSAGIPAWRASRQPIVGALKDSEDINKK